MEIAEIREAFVQKLSQRAVYKKLNVGRSTVASGNHGISEGHSISLDKMEESLLKYNTEIVQDKVWSVK